MAETHKGPLLRLAGLKSSQLPSAAAQPEELRPFITALLQEAVPLIDSAAPRAAGLSGPADAPPPASNPPWKPKGSRGSPDSAARIELSERVVVADGRAGPAETWVCRRSVHADSASKGTASWAEFVRCMRDRHAESEEAFTPTVLAHREAVRWAAAAQAPPVEVAGIAWGRFSLGLVEMKHKIPPPLRPRVFPVLQLVASAVPGAGGAAGGGAGGAGDEFVVVSVTVSDFVAGRLKDKAGLSVERGVVVGAYASVERVRRLPGQGDDDGHIEWVMATASDAKGVLPMFVQTLAVPGQIAKDVGMFMGWINKERRNQG